MSFRRVCEQTQDDACYLTITLTTFRDINFKYIFRLILEAGFLA